MSRMLVVVSVLVASPVLADERGHEDYQEAMELHGDRRWAEAAAKFVAAHQAGYNEDVSAYNAACALARAGRKDEAFRWLERAYAIGFDLEDYLDDDDDLRSLRGDPRFTALRTKVINGRSTRKQREAQRVVQRYQALHKDARPEDHAQLGRELLHVGRYDEAARAFLTAAARGDDPATSLYNAACARSLEGNTQAALDLLERAVKEGFADPEHLEEDDDLDPIRGTPRYRQIHALARELEVPDYPMQRSDRTPKRLREWQAALPRLEANVKKYPRLGQVWFNLGFARIVLGPAAQAVAPYEKAIELGYRKASSMYNLACAHALAGNKDQAFLWLERSLASGFDDWWLIRADADLDDIRYDPRFRAFLERARAEEDKRGKRSWR